MEVFDESNPIRSLDFDSVLSGVFFRMFLGLLASAITAFYAYFSGIYMNMILNNTYLALGIAEIAVVLIFSLCFRKLSSTAVTILYFAYAFLNGFTLSVIFAAYDFYSIGYCFLGSALFFGVLAYLGYKTDKDVSNMGTILTTALLIGLVLTLVNLFLGNTLLDIVLNWFILFVFFGLTFYDMNKIKLMQTNGIIDNEKLYVYGAMELYLDFINIFLRLLSILGKRKR